MGPSILVVDDNADNRKLLGYVLSDAGYRVTGAGSAERGLKLIEEQGFDLVLMDMLMPGIGGLEATRRLRGDRRFDSLPVIAVTGCSIDEQHEALRDAGITRVVAKPVDADALLLLIESILDGTALDLTGIADGQREPVGEPGRPSRVS